MPNISLPETEQEQIVAFIEAETQVIDVAMARIEREISLMQEYRTRLTADLVTGKLDVRDAAKKLPELPPETEAQDSELLDETDIEET